jgi:hypothetical protein
MKYPIIVFPDGYGFNIRPLISKSGATKGISESYFITELTKKDIEFSCFYNIKIGPYSPDIFLKTSSGKFLDIEIDERYDLITEAPTHFINEEGIHSDSNRNNFFISRGIIVLRFTENQVISYTDKCIDLILLLVKTIDSGIDKSSEAFLNIVPAENPWSRNQAKQSAEQYERQKLLRDSGLMNVLVAIAQGIRMPK